MTKFALFVLTWIVSQSIIVRADMPAENQLACNDFQKNKVLQILQPITIAGADSDRFLWIADQLLGIPYVAATLNSPDEAEKLIVRLDGLDCITHNDQFYALSHADDWSSYLQSLVDIRYKSRQILYLKRRHFFSDLLQAELFQQPVEFCLDSTICQLNERGDEQRWLPELPISPRMLKRIRLQDLLTRQAQIRTGDFIGFCSDLPGLDVYHTGILLRVNGDIWLQHASSRQGQVVREKLWNYASLNQYAMIIRPTSSFGRD